MSMWDKIFGKRPQSAREPEAVILHIVLVHNPPSEEEVERWQGLQEQLAEAIDVAGAGEFDGDGWGDGMLDVFMYGPSADALWDAVAPVIEKHAIPKGSHAIKRYRTPAGDREERIDISWDG